MKIYTETDEIFRLAKLGAESEIKIEQLRAYIADLEDNKMPDFHPSDCAMQWIPVNEKQPELFVKCLIFYAIDEFRIADSTFGYFDGNKFQFRIKIPHENPVITHWMPLPEPPKGR